MKVIFGSVISVFLLLSGLAPSLLAAQTSPQSLTSPASILTAMKEKYLGCSSFSADFELNSINQVGEMKFQTIKKGKMLFSRPNAIRIDWSDEKNFGSMTMTSTNSLFTDKDKYYTYSESMKESVLYKTMGNALAAETGVSERLTCTIPGLLTGSFAIPSCLSSFNNSKLVTRNPDAVVEGIACYRLEGVTRDNGMRTIELSIAKDTLGIVLINDRAVMTQEEQEKLTRQTKKAMSNLGKKFKNYPKLSGTMKMEAMTHFRNVKWNPPLSRSDFVFTLPKDIKPITEAEWMKNYLGNRHHPK